jgi:cytochrome P450
VPCVVLICLFSINAIEEACGYGIVNRMHGDTKNSEVIYCTSTVRSRLTDDEVVAQAFMFLIAGYETTATALTFVVYNLAKHVDCQRRAAQEIDAILTGVRIKRRTCVRLLLRPSFPRI